MLRLRARCFRVQRRIPIPPRREVELGGIERAAGDATVAVDLYDVPHCNIALLFAPKPVSAAGQRLVQNLSGGGVDIDTDCRKVDDGKRIVALDQPQLILFGEHRERERALNLFRHTFEAGQVEGLLLLNELHSDKTICLHLRSRQVLCAAQLKVVPNNAIMRQCKGLPLYTAKEGMVVVILFCTALRRHARMSHDDVSLRRNTQMQPMRRQRALVNLQPT